MVTNAATIAERYKTLCNVTTTRKLRKMLVHALESDERESTLLRVVSYFLASTTPYFPETPDPLEEESNKIASDVIRVLVASPKSKSFSYRSEFKRRTLDQDEDDRELLRIDEFRAPKTRFAKDSAIMQALDGALRGTLRQGVKPDPTIYHKFWACARIIQMRNVPVFFVSDEWKRIEERIADVSPEVRLAEACCARRPPRDYVAEPAPDSKYGEDDDEPIIEYLLDEEDEDDGEESVFIDDEEEEIDE